VSLNRSLECMVLLGVAWCLLILLLLLMLEHIAR
jgi:hypothetical protein